MRLGFYEGWLNAEGLRDGTIGLAPLYAVLSFRRQEGDDAYGAVAAKAGRYAAEWTVESMRPFRRATINRLPAFFRRRVLLGEARSLVRMSYESSRASWQIRRGQARVTVSGSVFCSVREPATHPLCGYYAAAYERLLSMFELPAPVLLESCRATGESACVLTIPFTQTDTGEAQEAA
ncbi:MAG TPA: hypothetical protein VF488_07565 [Gemmatimonadaceae bacterium]